eukprot:TRINITY_DN57629_c0_g1_i1.p1 TRINITY_DN57629_c0_g1~~TRINITY_DN57629_c0_g1_i1.p1  ORF type:complete len:408 (+),score=80.06 TRINITY_DN57629_c0_g1_i1:57-1280(+)
MDTAQSVTCTSCNIAVHGAGNVRVHYRSDIHLVNVKRRVSGLSPLSAVEFSRRVQALQASKSEVEKGKRGVYCDVCQKRFASEKAFRNHQLSRRHRDKMLGAQLQDTDWMSSVNSADVGEQGEEAHGGDVVDVLYDDDDEKVERVLKQRLDGWHEHVGFGGVFDDEWFESAHEALLHMQRNGFFVPFRKRLCDVEGLVRYLSQKVCVGFACVLCERSFGRADAARKHMRDVGHGGMTDDEDEWMEEYGDFYDWSVDATDDAEGWQEVDAEEAEQLAKMQHVKVETEHDAGLALPVGRLADDEMDGTDQVALVVGDRVLGHRALRQFYKQRIRASDEREAVVAARGERQLLPKVPMARRDGRALPLHVSQAAERKMQRMQLSVGRRNYYTRKARFRQRMAVLNSGYRA